ncbi:hypothetical protein GGS24DRAFT_474075 [Hypoxylon argillaceum]|nr:hypothetical protein GGS24DRAFT_474075 [Hypoxylon argillaceum]
MATQTSLISTPTELPASITSPPTIQFTPPPECFDLSNNWIITTSCYIQGPGIGNPEPDWLTCTLTNFGPSQAGVSSCSVPFPSYVNGFYELPKVTVDGIVSYYSGCPAGFTPLATHSSPAWDKYSYKGNFDASVYSVNCCPTQYDFVDVEEVFPFTTYSYTEHNGIHYSLYYYPLPGCALTSVQALSGKTVAYQTWSATRGYDKRQAPVTELWDYEHGTLFAESEFYWYTVYQGTHTCFDDCDRWFTYYYPDGVGTPAPASTTESLLPPPVSTSVPVSSSVEAVISSSTTVEETFPPETSNTLKSGTTSDNPSTEGGAIPTEDVSTGVSTTSSQASGTTAVDAPNGSVTDSPLPTAEAYRSSIAQLLITLVLGIAMMMAM